MINYYPNIFKTAIGGYFGNSYSVEWKEKQLCYEIVSQENKHKNAKDYFSPTSVQWRKFWDELNKIGIYNWESRYESTKGVCDGTSWELEIDYNGKTLKTSGSNAYPVQFEIFLKAIQGLIEGKDFQ